MKPADSTGRGDGAPPFDALLNAARGGSGEALGTLLERHRNEMLAVARGEIGQAIAQREDASDALQDACCRAFNAFATFRGATEAEFRAWLRRVAQTAARDLVARHLAACRDVERNHPLDGGDSAMRSWFQPESGVPTASFFAIEGEHSRLLMRAIARLPEEQRVPVELHYLKGHSFSAIAAKRGEPLSTIATRVYRALERLRKELDIDRK